MDDLSVNLKECPTGCIAGGTIVNHLMYADDIVLLSPSATGLSLLVHVCGKYGLEHDIRFNSKKSAVIIVRNSFVKDFSYPSFVMNGESIKEQGRRSGYKSGGDGIHVNPDRSFGGTNGEPSSEASQLRKGGPGVLPRKISKTYMANGAIYVIPEIYL